MPVFLLTFVHNVIIWSFQLSLEFITTPRSYQLVQLEYYWETADCLVVLTFFLSEKIIKLTVLIFNEFILHQDTIFSISALTVLMRVSKSLCLQNKFVSSAKGMNFARLDVLAISLMYKMNRRGPKMEPWGHHTQLTKKESQQLILTYYSRLVR